MCDINDAIKEGDGERLMRLYKVALLIFKCYGCTKYAYITLLLLVKVNALLTEKKADQLVNNRFFSTHGNKGKNIPLDLKMEQLNNLLKAMLKILGSNLNEKSTHRIARSITYTELILASLDSDCMVGETGHYRSLKGTDEAVKQIVTDLISEEAFQKTPGREGYPSFPEFNSNFLASLDYREVYTWMTDKFKLWEKMYQR